MAEANIRGVPCWGAARSGSDLDVDITNASALEAIVYEASPTTIVNCVALTDHALCEDNPGLAYILNARIPGQLARLAQALDTRLVQISTDHYFTGDGPIAHAEDAEVTLLNEYARSKYAGERLALTNRSALVIRTNIVGLRRWPGRPTFAEWALDAIESHRPLTLFDDFFTSSMHARACAAATLDLLDSGARNLINVASSQVSSKRAFVLALARELDIDLQQVRSGSVRDLRPRRAESLGLDVTRAQSLLGRTLPGLAQTVAAIAREHHAAVLT